MATVLNHSVTSADIRLSAGVDLFGITGQIIRPEVILLAVPNHAGLNLAVHVRDLLLRFRPGELS
jgi:hypothetical protein